MEPERAGRALVWEPLALLALAAALRLAFFNDLLVGGDPQDRLFYGRAFARGDFSWMPTNRPWLLEALIGVVFWLSPRDTVAAAKLVPLAFSLALIPVAWLLAREVLGSRPAAAGATLLVAAATPLVEDSCYLSHQAQFTFFAASAALFSARFLRTGRAREYAGAFVCAALALYSYIVGFMVLAFVLALGAWRLRLRLAPYVAALGLALWLLPFDYLGGSYYGYAVGGETNLLRFAAGRAATFLQYYFPWTPIFDDPLDHFRSWKFLASAAALLLPLLAGARAAALPLAFAAAILAPYLPVSLGNPLYITPTLPLLAPAWVAGLRRLAPGRAGVAAAALGIAAYLALTAPETAGAIRRAHGDPDAADGVFHSMRLGRVIDWIEANVPPGRRLLFTGFWRYYDFFLGDRYALAPLPPGFEDRARAAGAGERAALYESLLLREADYLVLDDAFDFSDLGLDREVYDELTGLIAADAFAPAFRLSLLAELPGSARNEPRVTRVYRVEGPGETR